MTLYLNDKEPGRIQRIMDSQGISKQRTHQILKKARGLLALDPALRRFAEEPPLPKVVKAIPESGMRAVVQMLKASRKEQGLSIAGLCRKVGIATKTLSKIENFRVLTPKPETLRRLADGLGCNLNPTETQELVA